MARIYSRKKGKHGSKKPPVKVFPKWVKLSKEDVEKLVVKLSQEKMTPALIGTVLRDQYGIPDVTVITGKKISQIIKENNLQPQFPEDLMNMFKNAIELREHLKRRKKDRSAVKGLEHLESKIRRMVNYYTREGRIPPEFKYDPEKIKLIVQK